MAREFPESDPWHLDVLFETLAQDLLRAWSQYRQAPSPELLMRQFTHIRHVEDAIMAHIPCLDPGSERL